MKLTRFDKLNDSKDSYPKSALSSSLIAGCGLKLESWIEQNIVKLSSSLIAGCGLKLVGNKGINLCIPTFIQLNSWMWIEIP